MATKVCRHCGVEKQLSEFGIRATSADGRNYYCRECANEIATERRRKEGVKSLAQQREEARQRATKVCTDCGVAKPVTEFGPHKETRDGLNIYCRPCAAARQAAHKRSNGVRTREEWRNSFPVAPTERACVDCGRIYPRTAEYWHKGGVKDGLSPVCKECAKARTVQHRRTFGPTQAQRIHPYTGKLVPTGMVTRAALRDQCLVAYGGDPPSCSCCGETKREFLALHHPNGDGKTDRARFSTSYTWMKELRDGGFPPGLAVLCHNCNSALGYYGYCPHQNISEERSLHNGKLD